MKLFNLWRDFFNFIFYGFIHPWGISVINSYIFIGNIVSKDIHQCVIKSRNLFMNIFV